MIIKEKLIVASLAALCLVLLLKTFWGRHELGIVVDKMNCEFQSYQIDSIERLSSGWRVSATRIPRVAGGHRIIIFSKNGDIAEVSSGL